MTDFEITFEGFEPENKPLTGFVHYRWPSGVITSLGLYRNTEACDLFIEVSAEIISSFLSGTEDITRYYVGTFAGELALLPVGKRFLVVDALAETTEITQADFEMPVHIAVEHFYDRCEIVVRLTTLLRDCEIGVDALGIDDLVLTFVTATHGVLVETLKVPLQPLIEGESLTFPIKNIELRLLAPKILPLAFRRVSDALGHLKTCPGKAGFAKAEEGLPAPLQLIFRGDDVEMRLDPALGDIYRTHDDVGHVFYVSDANPAALLGGFSFSAKNLFETSRLELSAPPPPPGACVYATTLASAISYENKKEPT
jgi:hypothetical protein